MAAEKAAPPLPLSAVSVTVTVTADPSPFLPSVRDVAIWALVNAGCVAFTVVYNLIVTSIRHPPSWLLPRPAADPEEMTDAEIHTVLMTAMLWFVCVVFQAAAGSLALALPRRHRLLLAYAALVATTAGHCIWAGLYITFVVAPGTLGFWTGVNMAAIFFSGVIDVLCFRGLVFGGGGEEEEGLTAA